jgi:NAD(P)-dependent dehydrogenase (short-subunit alcohol dehydrogenase family)
MKKYIITGATSGIGKEVIKSFKNDFNFIITYRNEGKKDQLLNELNSNNEFLLIDLEKPYTIKDIIHQVEGNIDGLIYIAGIVDNRPLKMINYDYSLKIFNVNFFSFVELYSSLVKLNKLNSHSSSIVISSVTSSIGEKAKVIYSASKGALESAVRSIVKEVHSKTHRLNIIKSGMVNGESYENHKSSLDENFENKLLNRQILGLINTNDIVNVIKFLLSDQSRILNGTTINVDAGWLI